MHVVVVVFVMNTITVPHGITKYTGWSITVLLTKSFYSVEKAKHGFGMKPPKTAAWVLRFPKKVGRNQHWSFETLLLWNLIFACQDCMSGLEVQQYNNDLEIIVRKILHYSSWNQLELFLHYFSLFINVLDKSSRNMYDILRRLWL